MRKSLIAMIAGFIVCTAIRLYTIVVCTDMTSGFYYHDSKLLCNILYYGAIVLTFVGSLIAARVDEKGKFGDVCESDITGARAAVIGYGLLFTALFASYEGLTEPRTLTPSSMLIFADYAYAVGAAALAFIILYKKEFKPFMGFIMTFGGAYFTIRGINCFKDHMVVASVPEYVISTLSTVGSAVTFVMFARFFSGNSKKHTKKAMIAWGGTTAVMTLSSAAATGLAQLAAPAEVSQRISSSKFYAEWYFQHTNGNEGYIMQYIPLTDIITGLFIAVTLVTVLFAKHKTTEIDS